MAGRLGLDPLAQTDLAAHLCPHNLHKNAGRMDGLLHHHHLSCCPHLRIVKKNRCGGHIQHGHGRNDLLHRYARRGKCDVVVALLTTVTGGTSCLQVRALLPQHVRRRRCPLPQHMWARRGPNNATRWRTSRLQTPRTSFVVATDVGVGHDAWLCLCCAGYLLYRVNKVQ